MSPAELSQSGQAITYRGTTYCLDDKESSEALVRVINRLDYNRRKLVALEAGGWIDGESLQEFYREEEESNA